MYNVLSTQQCIFIQVTAEKMNFWNIYTRCHDFSTEEENEMIENIVGIIIQEHIQWLQKYELN